VCGREGKGKGTEREGLGIHPKKVTPRERAIT